ncbi:MAG: DUF4238 domain-containing protein [Halodesulfovibrio sp.]|uniref:DUF4238 domain-containing protein n=1 Tax=Halodesulfovibrio sp. TaxID=1912772 RepID=UPI00359E2B62
MSSENKTRRQHYVPNCLLKGFVGSKGKIDVFRIPENKYLPNQATENHFVQSWLYDTDNLAENFFSDYIESPASPVFERLRIDSNAVISFEERKNLIFFIACQWGRTLQAYDESVDYVSKILFSMAETKAIETGRDDLLPFEGNVVISPKGVEGERATRVNIAAQAVHSALLLFDLEMKILQNNTGRSLIVSDNPVILYNSLYAKLNPFQVRSLTSRGVQLFLPISIDKCLCLYDSAIYKYGTKKSQTVEATLNDVDFLNQLQMRFAQQLIAYPSDKMKLYVARLANSYFGKKVFEARKISFSKIDKELGVERVFAGVGSSQRDISLAFSFVKRRKKSKKYEGSYLERNPKLSAEGRLDFKEILSKTKRLP